MLPEEKSSRQNQAATSRCGTIKHCEDSGSSRADVRGFNSRPPQALLNLKLIPVISSKLQAAGYSLKNNEKAFRCYACNELYPIDPA